MADKTIKPPGVRDVRSTTRRRLTLLAVAGVATLGLLGGAYGVRKAQVERRTQAQRVEGLTASAAGDHARAVQRLRDYLGRRPNDVEALAAFVHSRLQTPDPRGDHLREAVASLRHLLRLDPDRPTEQRRLLAIYDDAGMAPEARDLADRLLKSVADGPDEPTLIAAYTRALERLEQHEATIAAAERWLAVEPTQIDPALTIVRSMRRTKTPAAKIVQWSGTRLEERPDDPTRQFAHAFALLSGRSGNNVAAVLGTEDDVDAPAYWLARVAASSGEPVGGVTLTPGQHATLANRLTTVLDSLGLTDRATTYLDRVRATAGPQVVAELRETLLRRYFEANRTADVLAVLGEVDVTDPSVPTHTLAILAVSQLRSGDVEGGGVARRALASRSADDPLAAAWAAGIEAGLEPPAGRADTVAHEAAKSPVDTLAVTKEAAGLRPNDPYVRQLLGEAYRRAGDFDHAVSEMTRAAELAPGWALPRTTLSMLRASQGRLSEALLAAASAANIARDLPTVTHLAVVWSDAIRSGVDHRAGDLLNLVRSIDREVPGHPPLRPILADTLARLDRHDEAKAVILQAVADGLPADVLLALSRASLEHGLGLSGRVLDAATAADGLTPPIALAKASERRAAGQADDGLALLRAAYAQTTDPADRRAWRLAIARFLDGGSDPVAAATAWREAFGDDRATDTPAERWTVGSGEPIDASVAPHLLTSRFAWHDRTLVLRAVDARKVSAGEADPVWRTAQARLLLTPTAERVSPEARAEDARRALTILTPVVESPAVPTEAWLFAAEAHQTLGDSRAAVASVTAARRQNPDSLDAVWTLVRLLHAQGDVRGARQTLEEAGGRLLVTADSRRQTAEWFVRLGDTRSAARALGGRDIDPARLDTASKRTLVNIYRRAGRAADADRLVTSLAGDAGMSVSPDAIDGSQADMPTLAFVADDHLRHGRVEEARRVLAGIEAMRPLSAAGVVLLADFDLRAGDTARAVERLRSSLAADGRQPGVWRALITAHLTSGEADEASRVLTESGRAVPDDLTLALMRTAPHRLAVSRDERRRPLVVAWSRDPGNPALGETIDGLLSPGPAEVLAKVSGKYPGVSTVRLQWVDELRRAGRASDAADVAAAGVRASGNAGAGDPDLLHAAALTAAEAGRWGEVTSLAQLWRDILPAGHPLLLQADVLIARAALERRQYDAVLTRLRPYLSDATTGRNDPELLWVAGAALHATGRHEEAIGLVDAVFRADARWRTRWLAYGVGAYPVDVTARWLEAAGEVIDPNDSAEQTTLAGHWDAIATRLTGGTDRSPIANDPRLTAVRDRADAEAKRLLTAVTARPNAPALAWLLAASRAERSGEQASAEAGYRRAIAGMTSTSTTPRDTDRLELAIARNNLAMLLTSGEAKPDRLAEAETLAAAAVEAHPQVAALHDTLATVRSKRGDHARAVESARRAVTLDGQNPLWQLHLADIYATAGEVKDARTLLDRLSSRHDLEQALSPDAMTLYESLRERFVTNS